MAAAVAAADGAPPSQPAPAGAAGVRIVKTDAGYAVTGGTTYTATVNAAGMLTNLRVAGQDFLVTHGFIQGASFYDGNDVLPMPRLTTPDLASIAADGDGTDVQYHFDVDRMTWQVHNKRDRPITYFLCFDTDTQSSALPDRIVLRSHGVEVEAVGIRPAPWVGIDGYPVFELELGPGEARTVTFALAGATISAPDAAPAIDTRPRRADDFVSFVGIEGDPRDGETFSRLGVRFYRAPLRPDGIADWPARLRAAYVQSGMRAMLQVDSRAEEEPEGVARDVAAFAPGVVAAVEGPGDVDDDAGRGEVMHYSGLQGAAAGALYQRDLYAALKSNLATAAIPVVDFSTLLPDDDPAAPDARRSCDFANLRQRPGLGVPESGLAEAVDAATATTGSAQSMPLVATGSGYRVGADGVSGLDDPENRAVSLRAQTRYVPELLAEYFRNGISRVYLAALRNGEGYGLLDDSGAPRPSYVAVHNLLTLLADAYWDRGLRRWIGADFTPRPLAVHLASGAPDSVHGVALEKRSGEYDVLLWNEVPVYDPILAQDIHNTPAPVTLIFGAPVRGLAIVAVPDNAGIFHPTTLHFDGSTLTLDARDCVELVRLFPLATASPHSAR